MKQAWCLPMMLGLARLAVAAGDTVALLPTPLELPARIGPMRIQGEPYHYQPASLGVSYQYVGSGLSLTVYVYDEGVADLPDGGDTVPNCYQFEQAKYDVQHAGYGDVKLVSERLVRLAPPDDAPLAREASFEFVRDGRPTISYLWITGFAKNFVKLRFSLDADLRSEVPEARAAILGALGATLKPHLAPADPDAKKPGTSMNLVMGGKDDDLSAGFMYTIMLSTILDKSPEQAPVCGGQYPPSYQADLAAFRGVGSLGGKSDKSPFAKKLGEIDAAGFLEEFVWVDMHRDYWGNDTPDGLTLKDYKTWKKKNLKRFKAPPLGGVAIDHPRPMAIETPEGL
jgi:hypothetical protein